MNFTLAFSPHITYIIIMNYKKFVTGPIETNTYVIERDNGGDGCLIIDPSTGCDELMAYLRERRLCVCAILFTHGHYDHIMGAPEITKVYGDVQIFIHDGDRERLSSPARNGSAFFGMQFTLTGNIYPLVDGVMKIGEFEVNVLHVPGHTQGGCAFLFDDVCFCGDTIFAGSVGRTDFPGGNHEQLIASIREKILTLPPQTVLCTGHGGRTTVDREMKRNPYL